MDWDPDVDSELAAASARHPGWDFHRVYGGVVATPKGTPLAHAFGLERLEEKIADLEGQ